MELPEIVWGNELPHLTLLGLLALRQVVMMALAEAPRFVIVAACVMTFEARDSAAKIVPARFRKTFPERSSRQEESGVRNSACQTKWETLGLYGSELMRQNGRELSRRAMTFAFIQFSKNLQSSMDSAAEYYDSRGSRPQLVKCPSAPSLVRPFQQEARRVAEAPRVLRVTARPAQPPSSPRRRLAPNNGLPRQTMSMDNPAVREVYTAAYPAFIGERGDEDLELGASATGVHRSGSEASLALDLHLPQCSVTLAVRDQSRSPSNARTDYDDVSPASPLLEPDLEAAGPSGLSCLKVDKQTSTSDHLALNLLGISRETWGSRDATMSSRATSGGGSFREPRRPRASRRVRRSETIDTATAAARRSHTRHHSSSGKHGSVRSGASSRSATEARRLQNSRSETARRHQFLRQQKVECGESQEHIDSRGGHFNV
ncbi:uncharacterized protein [Penaeus vannamei]|uniref:uncharacterized protein n=1 Tax=Penaeus vannamei TaxID=6689 RepID=UPI00387F6216